MIEIIDAVLTAADLNANYAMQGEYFEILEAQYPVDVYLLGREGQVLSVMRRSEASFFARPGRFHEIRIDSTQAQTVRFMVGSGDVGTRRISSTVQVIDGGRARTLSGSVFLAYTFHRPASPNLPTVQLWNHSASGRRLVVLQVAVSNFEPTAQISHLGWSSTALPTFSAVQPQNKLLSASGSVAQMRTDSGTVTVPNPMCDLYMPANGTAAFRFTEPVVVLPGKGLIFDGAVGAGISAQFEYYEEAI